MKATINTIGAVLVMSGLLLLAYVGFAYLHQQPAAISKSWTAAQHQKAHQLAQQLAQHQTVKVPRSPRTIAVQPGSEPALRMIIPKIRVNAPVVQTAPVQGVWQVADWSVGHLTTTPDPGAAGNGAYSAHDDIKGEIFKRVGELAPGDVILLRTRHSVYTYVVTNQQLVDPSNIHPLDPTAAPTITLISCSPYWIDTQRTIIQGVLKSTSRV